ncbi:MFS transporter [Aspergillus foveolatus]|uniref:MFS transporter n=1 Tax=Aspergillus foveolatus TaxID=210207 RepID=UPI003CCD9666
MNSSALDTGKAVVEYKPNTLGRVHLHDKGTNQIILIPTPSEDPDDPLNWPTIQKYYLAGLVCVGVFLVNFVAAGPAVALEQITKDLVGPGESPSEFMASISTVAYTQTVFSLMIGVGNLIWVPLAIKYGKRPVYIAAFLLMVGSNIWGRCANAFGSELASRIVYGFAGAAPEIVATLILTDLFFLHQRGAVMVLYTCALTGGVGAGIVISGLITVNHGWRMIYWVCQALISTCAVLVLFTLPETGWRRQTAAATDLNGAEDKTQGAHMEVAVYAGGPSGPSHQKRRRFRGSLGPFSTTYTQESLLTLIIRPIVALSLPAVLWASLVNSVTIGMVILISTNFSTAFRETYGFQTWQSGLTYVSSIVGSLIAILSGGKITDSLAHSLTTRNNGIRTPEMRLPIMIIPLISGPLGCMLYGVGIEKSFHWICPVIEIGLVSFTTVQSNNVSLVYILDSYRPISGEVVVMQTVFRAAFGFLLNFYANPWIQQQGYTAVFGILAGISAGVFLFAVPLYVYGDQLRTASWGWGFIRRYLHLNIDREVGE